MNIDQIKQWLTTPEMQEKLRYGGYGALGGAALGGVNHMMTNEDEEGSGGRLMKNLALGGAMGGVAGLGAHSFKDLSKPVKEKSDLEKFLDERPHPFTPLGNAGQVVASGARNPLAMGAAGVGASVLRDRDYIKSKDSKLNKALDHITGKDSKINEQWGSKQLGTEHASARGTIAKAFGAGGVTPQVLDSLRDTIGNTSNMPVGYQNDIHAALGDKANRYVSPIGGMMDKTLGGVQNVGIGLWNQLGKLTGRPAPTMHSPGSVHAGANTGLKPAGLEWLNKLTGLQDAQGNYASNAQLPGQAGSRLGLNSPTVAQSVIHGRTPTGQGGRMATNAGKWGLAGMAASVPIDMGMRAAGDKWLQSEAYKKHMQQAYEMAQQATKQQPQLIR